VWRSKEDFQAWRESSANSAAHSKAGEAEPMFDGPPSPVMYEGVLALLSEKGA
jgi:heme-degrading monooxygenase HmoA